MKYKLVKFPATSNFSQIYGIVHGEHEKSIYGPMQTKLTYESVRLNKGGDRQLPMEVYLNRRPTEYTNWVMDTGKNPLLTVCKLGFIADSCG
jgi:hypothetical protein